ncbi:hypothetical protein [Paracidovorax sp. MALMAid1276]|uniref:hypothetical protein n=1 Tax=Paracidovorax sp. MALMAid1276 TaxID=3411631 RepID=UPI003B9BD11C
MVGVKEVCVVLVLCVALSACSPHRNDASGADAAASQLIGLEYSVVPYSDVVAEGVPCKRVSTGDVWQGNAAKAGWSRGVLSCGDAVPYLFLENDAGFTQYAKSAGDPPEPYPRKKILAVQKLPRVANFSEQAKGDELPELVDSFAGQCDLDGDQKRSFVALVRWNGEAQVQGPPGIQAVWAFDVDAVRIVPVSPERVTCEPMLMD